MSSLLHLRFSGAREHYLLRHSCLLGRRLGYVGNTLGYPLGSLGITLGIHWDHLGINWDQRGVGEGVAQEMEIAMKLKDLFATDPRKQNLRTQIAYKEQEVGQAVENGKRTIVLSK